MFENHWTCTLCVFACAFACFQESDLHKNVVYSLRFFTSLRDILKELSVQMTVFVCSCHYLIFSSNLNVCICIFTLCFYLSTCNLVESRDGRLCRISVYYTIKWLFCAIFQICAIADGNSSTFD